MISLKNVGKGLLNFLKICIDFVCIAEYISRKRGRVSFLCVPNLMYWIVQYYGVNIEGQSVLIINISLLFSISPD